MIRPSVAMALLCCGPISGPLFLRGSMHWRNGDRVLAGLYGLLIALFWLMLPTIAGKLALFHA